MTHNNVNTRKLSFAIQRQNLAGTETSQQS